MKKLFSSLGILIIFTVGCGDYQSRVFDKDKTIALVTPTPYPVITPTPFEIFKLKKKGPRQVVHQVKKGLWIGGEK